MTTKELIQKAEQCLINGQIAQATNYLEDIPLNKVPRSEMAKTARVFRRIGMVDPALHILHPIVRPSAPLKKAATSQELLEYALCLQHVGAIDEACEVLESVPFQKAPQALLYKTVFRFAEWDYRRGIHHLIRLINLCPRDSYLNRLAQLHLATAFVAEEKYEEAATILSELQEATSLKGEYMIFCNSLEVSAQVAIYTKNFAAAEACLSEAAAILESARALDPMWVSKWRAILQAYSQNDVTALAPARQKAKAKHSWETLRELDLVASNITKDEPTILKLFFGTAFPGFRRRLAKEFGEMPVNVAYVQKDGVYTTKKFHDPIQLNKDLTGELSPGTVPHKLLVTLLADTYAGLRVGQLFNRIYPNEHFHPDTSAERVQAAARQLHKCMKSQLPGLQIVLENGFYKLDFSKFEGCIEIPKTLSMGAVERPAKNAAYK